MNYRKIKIENDELSYFKDLNFKFRMKNSKYGN